MSGKHTPGPWSIDPDDGGPWYCVREPGGGWIAQVPEPDSADARLIAAAPELLEVLRAVAAAGGQDRHGFANAAALQDDDALSHRVRAAIGQATNQEVTP